MHLHRTRPSELVPSARGEATMELTARDLEAIDLSLRVLLATSTPRDPFYEDVRRASEKIAARRKRDRNPA